MAEIILLEKITKRGNIGDIVEVKDGFARNYLIPFGKAIHATAKNKEIFKERRKEIELKNQENLEAAKKIALIVEGSVLDLEKQAGDDGKLYGSITPKDIAAVLSQSKSIVIASSAVKLKEKIKTIGQYEVMIELHPDVISKITLNVARTHEDNIQ